MFIAGSAHNAYYLLSAKASVQMHIWQVIERKLTEKLLSAKASLQLSTVT